MNRLLIIGRYITFHVSLRHAIGSNSLLQLHFGTL